MWQEVGGAAMTNFEKYGNTSVPEYCKTENNMIFGDASRTILMLFHKWGNSTATPTLTPEERKIAEALQVLGFEWLARDEGGDMWTYACAPEKSINAPRWLCTDERLVQIEKATSLFPSIQWTDEEPTKISDLLEVEI